MSAVEIILELSKLGITLEPRLKIKADSKPSDEVLLLIETHRNDLLKFLVLQNGGQLINVCRTTEEKQDGSVWCKRCFRYHTHACVPSDKRFGDEVN